MATAGSWTEDPPQTVGRVKKRGPLTSLTAEVESPAASARVWTWGPVRLDFKEIK